MELDFATRLLFAGLWTIADKAGRLEDRPKKIKINVFPADNVEIDTMLQALHDLKFITRYSVAGVAYIQVNNWTKHQNPHHTEKESVIPPFNGGLTVIEPLEPSESRKDDGGNPADSLIPDSLIPEKKPMSGKPDGVASEILAYLNVKTGKAFRPVRANLSLIQARIRESACPDDLKAVIDVKVAQWGDDPKMAEYLRPETLFGATKFAGYVGEIAKPKGPAEWWVKEGFGSRESALRNGAKEPA